MHGMISRVVGWGKYPYKIWAKNNNYNYYPHRGGKRVGKAGPMGPKQWEAFVVMFLP